MKRVSAFCFWCLALWTFCIVTPTRIHASGEFKADYDVQYAVAPSGTTIVTQNVTLTNEETNLYPQKYSITIDSENISNVIAFDDKGLVTPDINQQDGKTNIVLSFNDYAIGLNKQLHFSLRYENADIARKNGKIWEVTIPGVPNDPDLASYTVSLSVPPSFGTNAYMTPPPDSAGKWTKDQLVNGGISAAYGTEQIFSLMLTYYVENSSIVPTSTEIALPPDTAFQRVRIVSINPPPKDVTTDMDGNWLAQYNLLPAARLTVQVKAVVQLSLTPRSSVTETLSDKTVFTKPEKYWESDNPEIQKLAKLYTTPKDIYTYVTHALTYDYSRVNAFAQRRGSLGALANPKSAICMEFTDLFVAIARAAGIPAREAIGYAYTTNPKLRPLSLVSDVLHAWPEYYDETQKIWIPVDPTWANTTGGVDYFDKMDFNHIVFALNGQQSDYPYPAGFYKQSGSHTKDVLVQFTDKPPNFDLSDVNVNFAFPESVVSGFPAKGSVIIRNSGGVAQSSTDISIRTTPFDIAYSNVFDTLPPFGTVTIPVQIPLPGYFLKIDGSITATVNGKVIRWTFTVTPFIYKFLYPMLGAAVILCILSYVFVHRSTIWKHHHE